jgi:hypothetical protein
MLSICTMHKLKLHIYKSQHLLTVWPGKVQQWLALSLFLPVVLVPQMCCSFLILMLSEHSSASKAYIVDHSRNVPTYCTGQTVGWILAVYISATRPHIKKRKPKDAHFNCLMSVLSL